MSKSYLRSDLIRQIASENPGLTADEAELIVDCFFKGIETRLVTGGRVELRDFGAFSTRAREGRMGRNPRNGTAVKVGAKRVPYFKAGRKIRSLLLDAATRG